MAKQLLSGKFGPTSEGPDRLDRDFRPASLDLYDDIEEQFRRMAFNIIARNQGGHVKNIGFLMNKSGAWSLPPAFDMSYSYNSSGAWAKNHQMFMNGKRDLFDIGDFKACAKLASMKRGRAEEILDQAQRVVQKWSQFADQAGVGAEFKDKVATAHRADILT